MYISQKQIAVIGLTTCGRLAQHFYNFRHKNITHFWEDKIRKNVLLENSESYDYVSSYYYCNQNDVAVAQECRLPKGNTVEERHNILNNCLSKDNFNVIVAQKNIM